MDHISYIIFFAIGIPFWIINSMYSNMDHNPELDKIRDTIKTI